MTWRPAKDRDWRREALPTVISICKRTWSSRYDDRVEVSAKLAISWAEQLVGPESDIQISFSRVRLDDIGQTTPPGRGWSPTGYPALLDTLKRHPRVDAVPVVCGLVYGTIVLWDGWHRVSTYRLAGREDVPAIVVSLLPGDGEVRVSPSGSHSTVGAR